MRGFVAFVAVAALLGAASPASAQDDKPIQLAVLSPLAIYDQDTSIRGVRLSLLYGKNANVTGLDLGLVSHTTGDFVGVQFGLVGFSEGDFEGWQDNWAVNIVAGNMTGFQGGLVNTTETGRGFQFGAVNNVGRNFSGLQLGIVNYAQRIDGVQIGIVNVIKEGGQFPVFPIVNWGN